MAFKKNDLIGFYKFTELPDNPPKLTSVSDDHKLAWFIPDYGIGSGGHLNIFRMIHNLEKINISSDIYITEASQWGGSDAKKVINEHFFFL